MRDNLVSSDTILSNGIWLKWPGVGGDGGLRYFSFRGDGIGEGNGECIGDGIGVVL